MTQVNAAWGSGTDNRLILYLKSGVAEVLRVIQPSSSSGAVWSGRIVFHEGETLQLRNVGAGASAVAYVGGYLFTGAGAPMVPAILPA